MAAVTYTDGTERDQSLTNESGEVVWISPATMDSGDTVVLPTITGRTPRLVSIWDNTNGDVAPGSISSQTVTVDSGGGATNSVYVVKYIYQ